VLILGLLQFFVCPLFTGLGFADRLVLPYIPLLIVFALHVASMIDKTFAYSFVIIAALSLILSAPIVIHDCDPWPEMKAAGQYLNGKLPQSAILMDRKPYVLFYAGLRADHFRGIPATDLASVIDYGEANATHLVLSKRMARIFRPAMLPLFNEQVRTGWVDRLRLVMRFYPDTEFEILLFKFVRHKA